MTEPVQVGRVVPWGTASVLKIKVCVMAVVPLSVQTQTIVVAVGTNVKEAQSVIKTSASRTVPKRHPVNAMENASIT